MLFVGWQYAIRQWVYSYSSGSKTITLPLTMAKALVAVISGVGYAKKTFQREVVLANDKITISRNGDAEDGAYIIVIGEQ